MGKRTDSKTFFNKMRPYAEKVKAVLGVPVSVTLAQWAYESGFEDQTRWIGHNNYSGITNGGESKGFRKFNTIDDFVQAHIKNLSIQRYGYPEIVTASRAGRLPEEIAGLFAKSKWNTSDHYYINGKNILIDYIQKYDLKRFDSGGGQASQSISFTHPNGQTTQYAIDHGNKPSTSNDETSLIESTKELIRNVSVIFTGEFWEKTGLVVVGIVLFVIGFKFVLTAK